jgi:hypothetical protein
MSSESITSDAVLKEILEGLKALRSENSVLAASVDKINGRVNMLAGIKQIKDEAADAAASGKLDGEKANGVEPEKSKPLASSMSSHLQMLMLNHVARVYPRFQRSS